MSDIQNLPNTVPTVVRVEFLSDIKSGVGTKFRETRSMNGKETVTELEATECENNRRIRMVADSHGTVWDSMFTLEPVGEHTRLLIDMDAKAHKILPKILNPLMKGVYRKGLEKHIDAVKNFCEQQSK